MKKGARGRRVKKRRKPGSQGEMAREGGREGGREGDAISSSLLDSCAFLVGGVRDKSLSVANCS